MDTLIERGKDLFCSKCGSELGNEANFCGTCGVSVQNSEVNHRIESVTWSGKITTLFVLLCVVALYYIFLGFIFIIELLTNVYMDLSMGEFLLIGWMFIVGAAYIIFAIGIAKKSYGAYQWAVGSTIINLFINVMTSLTEVSIDVVLLPIQLIIIVLLIITRDSFKRKPETTNQSEETAWSRWVGDNFDSDLKK